MTPSDPRLLPALERAMPSDTIPDGSFRLEGIPCDVMFGDREWHHARILARWLDRHGREVVQLEWYDATGEETWGGEYLADPAKIREGC